MNLKSVNNEESDNISKIVNQIVVNENQRIENWLKESLRPYFGNIVDEPNRFEEFFAPKLQSKELEFIKEFDTYYLKYKGEIISEYVTWF